MKIYISQDTHEEAISMGEYSPDVPFKGGATMALAPPGYSGAGLPLIPECDVPSEFEKMQCEEHEWWLGETVPISLSVELPFWLMVEDCNVWITYEHTRVFAAVRGSFCEIQDGPIAYDSRSHIEYVGPDTELQHGKLPPLAKHVSTPVARPTKTIVRFTAYAMKDCFIAWNERQSMDPSNPTHNRRLSRINNYLRSLAYAHIPFLNRIITSYRSVSFDPYALELSEWDTPVWYAHWVDDFIPIMIMPYWQYDHYPLIRDGREVGPFRAAHASDLQKQLSQDVPPGKHELLDAISLFFRGQYNDAIRSIVTAIEVALESQVAKLLREQGLTEDEISTHLSGSLFKFQDRLTKFEELRQERVPGPLMHFDPMVNTIRLREELNHVRDLRHKIVHAGYRIDGSQRGLMQRAMETMTWLFVWLSEDSDFPSVRDEHYAFYNLVRGDIAYPFEYLTNGVRVMPREVIDRPPLVNTDYIFCQYIEAASPAGATDLLTAMSLEYLELPWSEGPPDIRGDSVPSERFVAQDGERNLIVYCLDFEELVDCATAERITERANLRLQSENDTSHCLFVVNHQRQREVDRRNSLQAFQEKALEYFQYPRFTVITATDLFLLIRGMLEHQWPACQVKSQLFATGRQGRSPSFYREVGIIEKFFPHHSAIKVTIYSGESISCGDIMAVRLSKRFSEESITSIRIHDDSLQAVKGRCIAGISTTLAEKDIKPGMKLYIRDRASIATST